MPQTINTLLAARLEGLPADERTLLLRASVEGALFHRSAVCELAPELPDAALERSLATLVRRDLIRPDRSIFAGDEAYRFRHLLIRDAAYHSLSKANRRGLARAVGGLARAHGRRTGSREYEEIVGYHLEQAYRCRSDLGSPTTRSDALGARASERLESAGRRALARSDLPAAIGLLERAASLSADDASASRAAAGARRRADRGRQAVGGRAGPRRRRGRSRPHAATSAPSSRALVQQQFLRLLHVAEGGSEEAARAVAARRSRLRALRRRARLCRPGGSRPGCTGTRRAPRPRRRPGSRRPPRRPRRRRARARRDPHLDRVVALVRADAGRRGHPRCEEIRAEVRGHLEPRR